MIEGGSEVTVRGQGEVGAGEGGGAGGRSHVLKHCVTCFYQGWIKDSGNLNRTFPNRPPLMAFLFTIKTILN